METRYGEVVLAIFKHRPKSAAFTYYKTPFDEKAVMAGVAVANAILV
jgi:hypothetical protein